MSASNAPRIKILPDGPYLVTGNVPLYELIIQSKGGGYIYRPGRKLPQQEQYALCRCGKSKAAPFCDGAHSNGFWSGKETACRDPYLQQAELIEGPCLNLTDVENLCAFARFCHADEGSAWDLVMRSDDPHLREMAVKTAAECPAGRLVAWDKESGQAFEPVYEPSIVILQDPERSCSGPIWARGGIQIEGADGYEYEPRNRVTLCRCGKSRNKPFCDAVHVSYGFRDKR